MILPKTRAGGASPTQKRPPPKKVFLAPVQFVQDENAVARPGAFSSNGETPFLAQTHFPRTAKRRCFPRRDFLERRNAVACPGAFSTNGKMPFLARTHFPLTAKRRSSSRRDFSENPIGWCFPNAKASSTQKGFPCPNAFSSNGETPFLARTYFLQTAKRRRAKKRVFSFPF